MNHAKTHDAQMAAINTEHAKRNRGGDAPVGGSMRFSDPGPKGKTPRMQNEMPALKKVAAGRPDTAHGKNVV